MSRFWVAGATGFLGSALVRELRSNQHEVIAVSRGGGRVDDIEVTSLDVLDVAAVTESARGAEGAFLSFGKVSRDAGDEPLMHRLHVQGTRAALLGLRNAGVRRVVVASTSGTIAVGTDPGRRYSEEDPTPHACISRWAYYRTKWYGEELARAANDPPRFEVIVTNPSLLLGPGDHKGSSTNDIELFLHGALPALPRGGLAFVDVRDAARGMVQAFSHGRPGERYLLSTANMSLEVFFGRLSRLSGVPLPRWRMPRRLAWARTAHWVYRRAAEALGGNAAIDEVTADMGAHYWYCDTNKAREQLGFFGRPVEETLRETVEDVLSRA